jgi:hypothetical protein
MICDKIKQLDCLDFSADFVMLKNHHTANHPKPVGLEFCTKISDFIAIQEVLLELQKGFATLEPPVHQPPSGMQPSPLPPIGVKTPPRLWWNSRKFRFRKPGEPSPPLVRHIGLALAIHTQKLVSISRAVLIVAAALVPLTHLNLRWCWKTAFLLEVEISQFR